MISESFKNIKTILKEKVINTREICTQTCEPNLSESFILAEPVIDVNYGDLF
jgi:hypothetical protein